MTDLGGPARHVAPGSRGMTRLRFRGLPRAVATTGTTLVASYLNFNIIIYVNIHTHAQTHTQIRNKCCI